jgi:RHS repeat-associated protein
MTTKETKNKNAALINKYIYGYNNVHMKKYEQRVHDSNKGDIFAYDGIYRLTGLKFNSPEPANPASEQFERQKSITFDKLSNILSIDETGNGQTQTITTDIPADSTYSKLNQYERFDRWGLSYDLNGNLTQRSTQHNVYDYRNRIVRATDVNSTVKFKYDPLGRRIQKEVTIGSQIKTTNFYYSGHQVIEERDGSDQVTRQLIYGNGIDEVIRVDKYNGTTSTPYYFYRNAIGSITAITDANGNIVERVYYDIYGMPTFTDAAGNVIPKSSIGNNILFQGREYDYELNLYYFRARYYDPIMGRFLSTDPMGYADSMNLYQAFNMNPLNFTDPSGTIIKKEDLYELKRINESQGPDAAKKWIDKNTNFTSGEKLDLHMKILFGFDDPDAEKDINYIPVWDEIWFFIDETVYKSSKPYLKFHYGVKHRRYDIAFQGLTEIVTAGVISGVILYAAPEVINFLTDKFPVLKREIRIISGKNPVTNKPRIGSGFKNDNVKPTYNDKGQIIKEFPAKAKAHGFNDIVDNYANQGACFKLGEDTVLIQIKGTYNGVPGRFEWIIEKGQVTHRMFVEGGRINGISIKK